MAKTNPPQKSQKTNDKLEKSLQNSYHRGLNSILRAPGNKKKTNNPILFLNEQ